MKKSVILLALTLSVVACKKSETTNNSSENSESSISNESVADSAATIVNDNGEIKNEEANKIQEKLKSEVNNSIDSMAKAEKKDLQIIDETPPDSTVEKTVKTESKPKIIKQTKIIYKEKPQKISSKAGTSIVKSGSIAFNVEDNIASLEEVKYLIKKYDGIIKSENLNANNDYQTNYISAKIPLKEYDYLIEDLIDKIGNTTEQNLEISGENYNGDKLCDLDITLYNSSSLTLKNSENQNFGEKTWSAFSKGWNAIGGIFLFFLPFWPIIILGGFAYYYFKKKKNSNKNHQ